MLAGSTIIWVRPHAEAPTRIWRNTATARCCTAADCTSTELGMQRHAVVSSLRSSEYIVMLRDLQCSLNLTNPSVSFIVLVVAGELSAEEAITITEFAEIREVPNIEYENSRVPRFGKNWSKLNAWNMTEFTSIILLDADTVVMRDLSHLFSLPTDFAWSYLNAPNYNYNSGGFIMLRPCQPVFEHMLNIVEKDKSKRFSRKLSEQSFFEWYFEFTGFRLPMIYNANFNRLTEDGLTASGSAPFMVHFADMDSKPYHVVQGDRRWEYMCQQYLHYHKRHSPLFV